MTKKTDNQLVTLGTLRTVLAEAFAASEERMEAKMDAKIRLSEQRMTKVFTAIMEAQEKRLLATVQGMINKLEQDTAELISDLAEHLDERFNKIEKQIAKLNKGYERLDNHSLRLSKLEAQVG